jgi:hypothetical protein
MFTPLTHLSRFKTTLRLLVIGSALLASSGCATAWHDAFSLLILTQPQSQTVTAEQNVSFSIVPSGTPPFAYQWFEDGNPISGANSSTLTISKVALSKSGSGFTVQVSNGGESLLSQPATLTVNPIQPVLTFAPIAPHVFGAAPFAVSASSPSSGPVTYSVASGPATVAGSLVTVENPGTVNLVATQAASGDYAAATASTTFPIIQNVVVSPISPAGQTMAPGQVTFSSNATGGVTDNLTWSASGGSFSNNTWTSPNTVGQYTISATSVDDPTKSVSTTANVSAPIITTQPASMSVCSNAVAKLSVSALYDRSYQWLHNGVALNGATSQSLLFPSTNAQLDAGSYSVIVSNPAGSVASNNATLSVGSSIISQPNNASVALSQPATFSVMAQGMSPFAYQWYVVPAGGISGTLIAGATNSFLTLPSATAMMSNSSYYATVTDSCGTVMTSTLATLTVTGINVPPTIVQQPVSQTVAIGSTPTLTVVASGTPNLTYAWYRVPAGATTGTAIPGASSASYVVPASATTIANNQDAYYVVVTNAIGQAASQSALLTIGSGIEIARQPANDYVNVGDSPAFSVQATSTLPLTYQWYAATPGSSSFALVPGATSSSLTLSSATLQENGSTYYVVVSNGYAAPLQSNTAALFVGSPQGVAPCEQWNLLGDAIATGNCAYQLAAPQVNQGGELVWPNLIATDKLQLKFTVTLSDPSDVPADGFAVVLGDPSLGATLTSTGICGYGLNAAGIPGIAVAVNAETWRNPPGPYIGVTRSELNLWGSPYLYENTNIPAIVQVGANISHDYVVSIAAGYVTVTMDGLQILAATVKVPPIAYLYLTASTGSDWERTVVSNLSATVSKP